MLECLIAADSSDDIVSSGLTSCFKSFQESNSSDITAALSVIEILLDVIDDRKILSIEMLRSALHSICTYLEGELGVAVLSLLLSKYGAKTKAGFRLCDEDGFLPIHAATKFSTVDVLQFIFKVCPDSFLEVTVCSRNLLHMALSYVYRDRVSVNAKVKYLCDKCPELLHMRNIEGKTPLLLFCCLPLDLNTMKIMCDADETIVSEKCVSNGDTDDQLYPLHLLWEYNQYQVELDFLSFASCVRFLSRLSPASVNDEFGVDPLYCLSTILNQPDDIMRSFLNADKTVAPEKRRDLNYAARREGMFLAFRALTNDGEPTIWIKLRHESRDLLMHTISYL